MTNKQINDDYKRFLETGCDYTQEMRERDQAAIKKAELLSLASLFLGAFAAGFAVAAVAGVSL